MLAAARACIARILFFILFSIGTPAQGGPCGGARLHRSHFYFHFIFL
jgi:hypothetical protein